MENKIINPKDGKEMILIPAGEFIMGSNEGEADVKPPHKIYLKAFYIARFPVTQAEYKKFVDATKYPAPRYWEKGKFPPGGGNSAVINITWHDAIAYCEWASRRLPTEAEWEKAASWDEINKKKRLYPWGNEFDASKCLTNESGNDTGATVDTYTPRGDSAYGVSDMAGDVREWCSTLYQPYPYSEKDGRENLRLSGQRILRGGSWHYSKDEARCIFRHWFDPNDFSIDIGFRVAMSLPYN